MTSNAAEHAVQCPGCGSHNTVQVTATWPNVLCRTCGTCWAPTAEGLHRVQTATCPGCPQWAICRAAAG